MFLVLVFLYPSHWDSVLWQLNRSSHQCLEVELRTLPMLFALRRLPVLLCTLEPRDLGLDESGGEGPLDAAAIVKSIMAKNPTFIIMLTELK